MIGRTGGMEKLERLDKVPGAKGSAPVFLAAIGISAIWVTCSIWFLLGKEPDCSVKTVGSCIKTVNDWGDFWAGTFSPLALVWLVVAVILQSMELKAQRAELALTRLEFKESREVAEGQAEQSKRQAEFIGVQTALLEEQEESRRTGAASAEFNATLEILAARLINYDNAWTFLDLKSSSVYPVLNFRLDEYEETGIHRIVIGAGQELRTSLRPIRERMPTLSAKYPYDFARVYRAVAGCLHAKRSLSGIALQIANDLELENLKANLDYLVDRTTNLPPALAPSEDIST